MNDLKNAVILELYDLAITPGSNKCFAKVVTSKYLKEDDLVRIAVQRRTELNASTLRSALEILNEVAMNELLNGASVNFGPGIFKLAVSGAFNPNLPEWNAGKHKIVLQVTPTTKLYRKMEQIEVKIRGMAPVKTSIYTVKDFATANINECLTRDNIVEIKGTKLKIAGENISNGISLIHIASGNTTLIRAEQLAHNFPRSILFMVPRDIEPGDYHLEITTQYSNAKTRTKEPRNYRFSSILKVV